MLGREKSNSFVELFSVELKVRINTLNAWFSDTTKSKYLNLNDIRKQIFIKKNLIVPFKSVCSICGFLVDVDAEGEHTQWHSFIVGCEHLF